MSDLNKMKRICLTNQNDSSLTQETALCQIEQNDEITIIGKNNVTRKSSSNNRIKIQLNIFKRKIMRTLKISLAFLLLILIFINSHFILFFHVKIEDHLFPLLDKEISRNGTLNELINEKLFGLKRKKMIENLSLKEIHDVSTCVPNQNWLKYFMENLWIYIDLSIIFIFPFLVMTLSFFYICFKVKNFNKYYAEFQTVPGHKMNRDIYERKNKKNKRIILILFFINFYFFISVFPYFVFLLFWEKNYDFLKDFLTCLFYSNNAMNFFFYGLSSSRFRDELRRVKLNFSLIKRRI